MADKTEKDAIFEEAQDKYGVKLDRRMKLSEMQDHLARLELQKNQPEVTPQAMKTPKTVRNVFTGNTFSYSPLFKGNPDLEVIEWEEEDGND